MCRLLLAVIACLVMIGCNAETFGYVKKAKYDILQKQLVNAEAELKAARQQESGCLHKYQFYNEGVRTWQLDLVTGQRCRSASEASAVW